MDAHCLKEDCQKQWELTKPLSSYSGSGPRCPQCGTTRVEVDTETPKPGSGHVAQPSQQPQPQQGQAQPPQQPQQGRQTVEDAQPPARTETHQQPDSEAMLAPQQSQAVGLAAAEVASSLASNDPEERVAAQGQALQAAGAGIAQLGERFAQQKLEGIRRSKERAGETLEKAESYASCPDCDGQIIDLPQRGEEFGCPHCGAILVA